MRKHGYEYPGEFIGALLDQGQATYQTWLHSARLKQKRGVADPIWRRVDAMVLLIVSIMQFGVEKTKGGASLLLRGHPDEVLTFEEVKRFFKKPTPFVFETAS